MPWLREGIPDMSDSHQFCTFYLGEHMFGIDVSHVQEVIRYQRTTRVPLAPPVVEGLINLRGQIVTAIDLRRRLGLPERPKNLSSMNVIVKGTDGLTSLLVDRVGDVLDLALESLEPAPETLRGIVRELSTGVYSLQEKLLLILDVEKVLGHECAVNTGN
jgi:purine-binding chemotaxis protein CheW